MASKAFTKEEKMLIARFLGHANDRRIVALEYGFYVLPSMLFAGYGLWANDIIAALVAYGALLAAVVYYLSYQQTKVRLFHSIFRKYEARVGVLKESPDRKRR